MLSILVNSRVKDNPDSNLGRLYESLVDTIHPSDRCRVEVLIRFDLDDDRRPEVAWFDRFPISTGLVILERGEGRYQNHNNLEHLFANRNPAFRWVLNMADDFEFTRPGWLSDLDGIPGDYMIVGHTRPTFELNARNQIYRVNNPVDFKGENGIGDYCPLFTAKLLEVCQNWGWQCNTDAWVVALNCTLYQRYGFVIWKQIPRFYKRNGILSAAQKRDRAFDGLTISHLVLPSNKYLFTLLEQQARNIYLNIMYPEERAPAHEKNLLPFFESAPPLDPDQQAADLGIKFPDRTEERRVVWDVGWGSGSGS